jgi:outer membrane protein assembly factor BamB
MVIRGGALAALLICAAACSGGPAKPAPTPAACPRQPPSPPQGGDRPGAIRWSVVVDRCVPAEDISPDTAWEGDSGSSAAITGNTVVFQRSGVATAYSLRDGRTLWRRPLTPRGRWSDLAVSPDVVLVQRTGAHVALDVRTGRPLWRADDDLADFYLAGRHVLRPVDGTSIEAYAPRTGRRLWRTGVTDTSTTTYDDGTVYLNALARTRDDPRSPVEHRIVRLDAATGRKPAPYVLAKPLRVDLDTGLDETAQGVLLLNVLSDTREPGVPIIATVALDAATGRRLWTRPKLVEVGSGPFGEDDRHAHSFAAVDPRTGRTRWTIPYGADLPALARPDHLVTLHRDDPAGELRGVGPHGRTLWTSPQLPRPRYLTDGPGTVLAITCTPGPDELCAEHRLIALNA